MGSFHNLLDYIEFPTDCGVHSIFSFKAHEELKKYSEVNSAFKGTGL